MTDSVVCVPAIAANRETPELKRAGMKHAGIWLLRQIRKVYACPHTLPVLLFVCGLTLHAMLHWRVLTQSTLYFIEDEKNYLQQSLNIFSLLRHRGLNAAFLNRFLFFGHHPQGVPLVGTGVYALIRLFGGDDVRLVILLTALLYSAVMIASMYRLGKRFYSRQTGVVAAALLLGSPLVFSYARMMMFDIPAAAMMCLAVVCLYRTDYFLRGGRVVIAALAALAAFFTKVPALLFLLPVFGVYGFQAMRQPEQRRRRFWFLVAFLISVCGIAVAAVVWNPNKNLLYTYTLINTIDSNKDFLYYLKTALVPGVMGPSLFFVMLPLLVCLCRRIFRQPAVLVVWVVLPLLMLSWSGNKVPRFLLTLLPPFFLMLAGQLSAVGLRRADRRLWAGCCVAVALWQTAAISLRWPQALPPPIFEQRWVPDHGVGRPRVFHDPEYHYVQFLVQWSRNYAGRIFINSPNHKITRAVADTVRFRHYANNMSQRPGPQPHIITSRNIEGQLAWQRRLELAHIKRAELWPRFLADIDRYVCFVPLARRLDHFGGRQRPEIILTRAIAAEFHKHRGNFILRERRRVGDYDILIFEKKQPPLPRFALPGPRI